MNKFPIKVCIEQTEEAAIAEMDYYDPDAENEKFVSLLDVEIGNSMEEIEIESWAELTKRLPPGYVISDEEQEKQYFDYLEENGLLDTDSDFCFL